MIDQQSYSWLCGATLLVAAIAPRGADIAQADLGPKPNATFSITVDKGAHMMSGALLMCEKDNCSDATPLETLGPQHFFCLDWKCDALAYGFSPYLQLQLTLSDGRKLTSQIFKKEAFDASFVATVAGDQLRVEEQLKQVGQ